MTLQRVVKTLDAMGGYLDDAIYHAVVAIDQARQAFGNNSETAYVLEHEVLPVLRLLAGRQLTDKAYSDAEAFQHESKTG